MKFSEHWLREWVNPAIDTSDIVQQLTTAGLEVDSAEPAAANFNQVVIGLVTQVQPHPGADRLQICQVDVGDQAEPLTIVCGAANVRANLKVPVAKIGAVLPGEFRIKQTKIRGQVSMGMICSQEELGLDKANKPGIMELTEDAPVGQALRDYLKLNDTVIEVDLTPNRGDCASIRGLARELAAINRIAYQVPKIAPLKPSHQEELHVTVLADKACPRYAGMLIKGVNSHAVSPIWLTERLRRSGINSIHPLVDITNYVMLELGQPMHAFDAAKLGQQINVRVSRAGEAIHLLDGQAITLTADTLIIADEKQPLAIAGVMGGITSAVDQTTTDVFLESAFFAPRTVIRSTRQYKLATDSSYRFERGVDYSLQVFALQRAAALVLEIVGGKAGPITMVESKQELPSNSSILLRQARIKRLLGIDIDVPTVQAILQRLEMQVTRCDIGWQVIAPSHRFDIRLEEDLIEEVARIYGYEHISNQRSTLAISPKLLPERQLTLNRIRNVLVDRGYNEIMSYSFVDPNVQNLFTPDALQLNLTNPISSELSVMRNSLWPGLLTTLQYNLNRQQSRLRLFEVGMCFNAQGNELLQENRIGGLAAGDVLPLQWGSKARKADFFDIKNDVESLLVLTKKLCHIEPVTHFALHPGQSGAVLIDGKQVGLIGKLHPSISQKLELVDNVWLFEMDLAAISITAFPYFKPFSKFPVVRRDIAILVDEKILSTEIVKKIICCDKKLLKNVQLFDIYSGHGIESSKKSVALGLYFQDQERTLIDTEVEETVADILKLLEQEFNATLRK